MEKRLRKLINIYWVIIAILLIAVLYKWDEVYDDRFYIKYPTDIIVEDKDLFIIEIDIEKNELGDNYCISETKKEMISERDKSERRAYFATNFQYYSFSEQKIYDATRPDSVDRQIYKAKSWKGDLYGIYTVYKDGRIKIKIEETTSGKVSEYKTIYETEYKAKEVNLADSCKEVSLSRIQYSTTIQLEEWPLVIAEKYNWKLEVAKPTERKTPKVSAYTATGRYKEWKKNELNRIPYRIRLQSTLVNDDSKYDSDAIIYLSSTPIDKKYKNAYFDLVKTRQVFKELYKNTDPYQASLIRVRIGTDGEIIKPITIELGDRVMLLKFEEEEKKN